jgi:hypothetical protein
MTKARCISFLLFLLGCAAMVSLGFSFERVSQVSMADFTAYYYPARCLVQHSDPYRAENVLRVYQAVNPGRNFELPSLRQIALLDDNLPTAIVFMAPIVMLPWSSAHLLWMALIATCFILACWLMWNLGSRAIPGISGGLVFIFLFGSELLLEVGNLAGIVTSLSVIACWCFLEDQLVPAGTACLALSLLLKPHVAGFILLYFFLAGGENRKRALKTLMLTGVLAVPAVLWVSHVAPGWRVELQGNLHAFMAHGGVNDPGPLAFDPRGHGAVIVSLQTVFSLIRDNPRFYDPATYLFCAPFLVIWALAILQRRFSAQTAWLALAAIAALSMLPLYHRQHDTRMLILTIPAVAVLWEEAAGWVAQLATVLTVATALLTANFSVQFLAGFADVFHLSGGGFASRLADIALTRPVPFILLITGTFYLWAYTHFAPSRALADPEHAAPSWRLAWRRKSANQTESMQQ